MALLAQKSQLIPDSKGALPIIPVTPGRKPDGSRVEGVSPSAPSESGIGFRQKLYTV
jgi:hypothetical protein